MDDDTPTPRREYPLSPAKMSKTPSWVMLGFVLGALTVVALPPLRKEKPAPPAMAAARTEPAGNAAARPAPQLSTIEAVFEEWARGAVWDADSTEVALWNAQTRDFTDYYEVLRYAGRYYFRTLPSLTRRVIARGKPIPNCPLLFTETEEQYQEWLQHGRSERPFGDYRPVSAFSTPEPADPRKAAAPRVEVAPPKFEAIAPFTPPKVESAVPGK